MTASLRFRNSVAVASAAFTQTRTTSATSFRASTSNVCQSKKAIRRNPAKQPGPLMNKVRSPVSAVGELASIAETMARTSGSLEQGVQPNVSILDLINP